MRSMMSAVVLISSIAAASAQGALSGGAPYCADLKRVAALGLSRDRFVSITGKPREGSFSDTSLPLTGWGDCALFGAGAYTCDSLALKAEAEAMTAQAKTVDQILSCFAGSWLEIQDRSSPGYVVLHPRRGAASITLSIDQNESNEFVVRLTLFLR